jgi:hypothetical protein
MRVISKCIFVLAASLLLANCQGQRVGSMSSPYEKMAAPAGVVTANPLPAPSTPSNMIAPITDPSKFPNAPVPIATSTPLQDEKMQDQKLIEQASATAPDVTVSSVAGVWNVSIGGQNCKVAMPQTKMGAGFRAGPLKCPAEIANVKSWNVAGKQLVMYDESGTPISRLYSTGSGFSGQTSKGAGITLSR